MTARMCGHKMLREPSRSKAAITREVFLEKNAEFGTPDVFQRIGIWANAGDGGFDIVDVYANSPAEEAGLKNGDKVIAVNGKAAVAVLSILDFCKLLLGPVGSKLKLDIVRGAGTLTFTVTLRDLV